MHEILTSQDIEAFFKEGKREVVIGDNAIVTAIACEIADRLGIKLIMAREKAGLNAFHEFPNVTEEIIDLLIKNGKLVIPGLGIVKGDLLVHNGKIVGLMSSSKIAAKRIIDADDRYVIPGVVDPHVHLGLFQPLDMEMKSELKSALVGGITTVGLFLGGEDSHLPKIRQVERYLEESAEADIFLHACIMNRIQLDEIDEYLASGISSFKFYMCGIPGLIGEVTDDFLLEAFKRLSEKKGAIAVVHAENGPAVKWATEKMKHINVKTLQEWSNTHPVWAEVEAIERATLFAEVTGIPIYFVHISSQEGLNAVRRFKQKKLRVFAETTSPYLTLNFETTKIGVLGKMSPPIRSLHDSDALWEGCFDGSIDTIGTDNVTLTKREKKVSAGMWEAIPGYPALGTHLSSLLDKGVHQKGFDLVKLVELISTNPAKIFGLFPQKGTLLPGSDADIVILDLDREKTVVPQNLYSRSDFSLFDGERLKGWPLMTIKSGKVIAEDGYYLGEGKGGEVIFR